VMLERCPADWSTVFLTSPLGCAVTDCSSTSTRRTNCGVPQLVANINCKLKDCRSPATTLCHRNRSAISVPTLTPTSVAAISSLLFAALQHCVSFVVFADMSRCPCYKRWRRHWRWRGLITATVCCSGCPLSRSVSYSQYRMLQSD
jgi:hypothetical protein